MMRRLAVAMSATGALVAGTAHDAVASPPTKEECIEANEQTQRRRRAGKLRSAREAALLCAQSDCPPPLSDECATWLREIDSSLPRVVLQASDAKGRAVVDARVYVDNELIATRLDGRSLAVDPGAHLIRFEAPEGSVTVRETIVEGQPLRAVTARLVAPPPPGIDATSPDDGGVPAIVYPLGGLAALGLANFAFFALRGSAIESDLRSQCGPECSPDETRPVLHHYIAADVALGVSVLSLAAATWFALRGNARRDATSVAPTRPRAGGRPGVVFVRLGQAGTPAESR
jgi:hypothetical protein